MQDQDGWAEEWYVWAGPPLIVVIIVLWMVLGGKHKPAATPPPANPPGTLIQSDGQPQSASAPSDPLGGYVAWIQQHQPTVVQIPRQDLADGQQFNVASVDMKNNYVGGEATDLMSLTMDIAADGSRAPVTGKQEWQLKTTTSPTSHAAYMEVDFLNAGSGAVPNAEQHMREWDLARLCPPLAKVPPAEWSADEQQYVHYLTRRTMGFDNTETGFAALWAAYASNFALWHGDSRSVPAAAFYALAAAHFEQALAAGGPPEKRAVVVTWMITAELHRLLGQLDDARRCLGEAEKRSGDLQEMERGSLTFLKGLLDKGDIQLERLPDPGMPTPPIGWYIDYIFPAVNADLDVERGKWSQLKNVPDICAAINDAIASKH